MGDYVRWCWSTQADESQKVEWWLSHCVHVGVVKCRDFQWHCLSTSGGL